MRLRDIALFWIAAAAVVACNGDNNGNGDGSNNGTSGPVIENCTQEEDAEFCGRLKKNCGVVSGADNCGVGRSVNCGSCESPETCGGAGEANVCGCTPRTCADSEVTCGEIDNECAEFVSCTTGCLDLIAAGGSHTCGRTGEGLTCWGSNRFGQLGDDSSTPRSGPTTVVELDGEVAVAALGDQHSCALVDGGVRCWGRNDSGQLGDGAGVPWAKPVNVLDLSEGVEDVAAGTEHSCAATSDGTVFCWGSNSGGQLGLDPDPDPEDPEDDQLVARAPVQIQGVSGAVAVTGGEDHSCASTGDAVLCWGANDQGQLGNGVEDAEPSFSPVEVAGISAEVVDLCSGERHSCVLTGDDVKCWGSNNEGQLGDGSFTTTTTPVTALGLQGTPVAIACGGNHTCTLLDSGSVRCWGAGGDGQIGDGVGTNRSSEPRRVVGLNGNVTAIAAGGAHTCAVLTDGTVRCWGRNLDGQLGTATGANALSPVEVPGHF